MRTFTSFLGLTFATLALMTSPCLATAGGGTIQETAKVLPSDGAAYHRFGRSVDIQGATAIVGAPATTFANTPGAAYLFDITSTEGPTETAKLMSSDAEIHDHFGTSVSLDGDHALVGAPEDDDNGADSGSVYLFDTNTGSQLSKLLAFDGAAEDLFGTSVSLSGDLAVIGAVGDDDNGLDAGAAYVFNIQTGLQVSKLLASDGAPGEGFGVAVAIEGARVVVGSPSKDGTGIGLDSGAVYVFDAISGAELAKIELGDAEKFDRFGGSVAISGDIAIIGATGRKRSFVRTGGAYLYDLNTYQQHARLSADDADHIDYFGHSVSISGGTAVVGSIFDRDNGFRSGSAYLFDVETGFQVDKLITSDGEADDNFGAGVGIHEDVVLSGAVYDDDYGSQSGSAYLFDLRTNPGTPYCFGDDVLASCPCGNLGAPGTGCANSTGAGALLRASGSASLSAEDLVLEAANLPSGPGLFFQGDNAVASGAGDPFGDGLRCAGGGIVRLQVRFSANSAAATSLSIAAKSGASAGETKRYQYWYRDESGSPCGAGFNLSNGYELTWTP